MKLKIHNTPFFFLPLSPRPTELCGSYHLLQSCFSFFIHLHGQPEPFGSYHLLQPCSSFFFRLHGQPSDHLRGLLFLTTFSFPLVVFGLSFLLGLFHVLSSAFLCSSVSEALFALSFSFEVNIFFPASFSSMLNLI